MARDGGNQNTCQGSGGNSGQGRNHFGSLNLQSPTGSTVQSEPYSSDSNIPFFLHNGDHPDLALFHIPSLVRITTHGVDLY